MQNRLKTTFITYTKCPKHSLLFFIVRVAEPRWKCRVVAGCHAGSVRIALRALRRTFNRLCERPFARGRVTRGRQRNQLQFPTLAFAIILASDVHQVVFANVDPMTLFDIQIGPNLRQNDSIRLKEVLYAHSSPFARLFAHMRRDNRDELVRLTNIARHSA